MKYAADTLSLLRALAAIPVAIFTVNQRWEWALLALLLGWATDTVDGAAARRWGSLRDQRDKLDVDGLADSALAFVSTAAVAWHLTTHYSFGWTAWIVWTITVIVGATMALMMDADRTAARRRLVAFNMIVSHGLVQIIATLLWFAYMADGKGVGLWTIASAIVLAAVTVWQRDKVALWYRGEFAPETE